MQLNNSHGKEPQVRSRRPLVVAMLLIVGAAPVLAACARVQETGQPSEKASTTTEPGGVGSLWTRPPEGTCDCHGEDYETLEELVTESDLIIMGTVGDSRVAEVRDKNDEFPTRTVHTTVAVDEVLKSSGSHAEVVVSTQELGFGGPGVDEWREPGRRVILFLTPSLETAGVYVPSNQAYFQAAYIVRGEDLEITVASGADVYGLNRRVAAMTVSELRDKVEAIEG